MTRRRFAPVSLRGRLALLFTAGSAIVLVLAGILIYLDLNGELNHTINTGLEARATDIEGDIQAGRVAIRQEEAFAQILGPGATVIDSSAPAPPALSPAEVARASRHNLFIDRRIPHTPALGRRARLLAHPVQSAGRTLVVVVGASTVAVFRGRERLALILAILSPLLGAILSAGGWLLAGAALRPVRRMSEEADAISLALAGRRLPYPEGEDEIAQLGRTLNAMLDRIEAAFARERMFLDDASHELRTPIA
ncbi:MAG TPA: HAMP domain-containing protein, partial [Acidimicrobiia bacterium]|nr:HAMP domain-containing protein [Acidimicrobiia bacterium]